MDLFNVGDQKKASLRMLKHLETYPSHRDAATWIAEFQAAVKGQAAPPSQEGSDEDEVEPGAEEESAS